MPGSDVTSSNSPTIPNAGATSKGYPGITEYGSAQNTISVSSVLPASLKVTGNNQQYSYSSIIAFSKNTNTINKVFPNPFITGTKMQLESALEQSIRIKILTNDGKILQQKYMAVKKGINNIVVEKLHSLSAGMYILQIITETGTINNQLIKN